MGCEPAYQGQQCAYDAYAPGDELVVAFFTHSAHNAMHFCDLVFDIADLIFYCFYLEFQHAVTFCTQLNVGFETFLFNIRSINHGQAPMAYLWR